MVPCATTSTTRLPSTRTTSWRIRARRSASSFFDSLTQFDFENEEIKPLACDSWDVNDDATEFTFHLKEGTTFHNGDTVVAADWKRGWERILDPNTNPESPSGIGYHLAMVDGYDAFTKGEADELTGVTCPDDNTLVVKLAYSYADFPYVVSHPALAPVPAVALDDFQTFFRAPIGNGPFKMDGKWEDGQYINIVRYDDYYGDKAIIDSVNFIIQKDQETAYREFQAGNLDVCDVPATQIPEARDTYGESEDGYTATPGHQLLLGGEPSTYYLTVNCSVAPWDNADFRRAVSMAINREAICDEVFHGTRTPADNIVPPGINGYEEGVWTYCKYDPDAAKELLAQIYPDGNIPTIKLTYNMDGGHKEVMDVVMASLKEVGITAEADTNEVRPRSSIATTSVITRSVAAVGSRTIRSWTTSCTRCSSRPRATTTPRSATRRSTMRSSRHALRSTMPSVSPSTRRSTPRLVSSAG